MRLIGVIDVLGGRAVHACRGTRERYQPVGVAAGRPVNGDASALARVYIDDLGVSELYAADLDALVGGGEQDAVIASLATIEAPLWLDAGVSSVNGARRALARGAYRVIVALETLPSWSALAEICAAVGGHRVAFSLDLRGGRPIAADRVVAPGEPVSATVARAVAAGVGSLIVIDVARVGTRSGVDLELLAAVRDAASGLLLMAGGGVRGVEDVAQLASCGYDGALVATALHDGRIGRVEVAACDQLRSSR